MEITSKSYLSLLEGVTAKKVQTIDEIEKCWENKIIPVVVDLEGEYIEKLNPDILIDAIIAKKNLGTNKKMAPITIALGPGFIAGEDVNIVIETMRGHNLGKVISYGCALENTGVPGEVAGVTKERVIYAQNKGMFKSKKQIGDFLKKGETIGFIEGKKVTATIDGLLRGLIHDDYIVEKGLKIADIDPRKKEYNNCFTISDKARSLGGAVLEGILSEILKKEVKNGIEYFRKNI
ncbi:selenium-dependent molybdenum cofactor biosynthesis protein YqeB [Cetobacterium sp.]|uniref:selenium-dependent molybdenum cofactor biosynthesis protein YqeB n=1 Tax=Cetobacterium sp. TaxID=2071632 RepID=UPI003F34BDA8